MVSVRSGAAASMPGSMETLLNVGLSRNNVRSLMVEQGTLVLPGTRIGG